LDVDPSTTRGFVVTATNERIKERKKEKAWSAIESIDSSKMKGSRKRKEGKQTSA